MALGEDSLSLDWESDRSNAALPIAELFVHRRLKSVAPDILVMSPRLRHSGPASGKI